MNSFLKYFTYPEFRKLQAMDDMYRKAFIIANKIFYDKVDKYGAPYINHLNLVQKEVSSITEKIVALLHELFESTEIVADDLYEIGFSEDIIDAIVLLTRDKNENYDDFIMRIIKSENLVALKVKVADMKSNINMNRIINQNDKKLKMISKKYELNYKKLMNKMEERMLVC